MEPLSENYTNLDEGFFAKVKKGVQDTSTVLQIKKLQFEIAMLKRSNPEKHKAEIEDRERQIKVLEDKRKDMKAMIDIIEQLHHRVLSLELKMQGAQHTY